MVDPLHHLGLGVEDHDAGDGAEYLVLAALVLVLQAGDDGRRYEVSLGQVLTLTISVRRSQGFTLEELGVSPL